jgi:hypothetical protein
MRLVRDECVQEVTNNLAFESILNGSKNIVHNEDIANNNYDLVV